MMNRKAFIGTVSGIAAAVCYGTNPLGALKLYGEGLTTNTVLLYRFGFALLLITAILLFRRESLRVTAQEFKALSGLGLLFAVSSMTLYSSFRYISAGIASTILFVYPVMTAAIMALFFKERITATTVSSILLSLVGVALLYWGDSGGALSTIGVLLVVLSALTYAVYIIVVDRSHLHMSAFKINFYVLLYCVAGNLVYSLVAGMPIQPLHNATCWFYVGWLSVVPTIFALVLMVYAAKYIGSTPTAILGALEPLSAVMIGIFVFGESFTLRLAMGILLILGAVLLIVLRKAKV